MSRKDLAALLAYLAENGGRHPMEALRGQIIKAGHSPADAERAIAIYQGRVPPPEPPVWAPALLVALADFALAGLCWELLSRQGVGRLACSSLALVPGIYLVEIFGGLVCLASGKERWGRTLLLGVLLFFALGLLGLLGLLVQWAAKAAGS
jgi:hypothetical protein